MHIAMHKVNQEWYLCVCIYKYVRDGKRQHGEEGIT